MLGSERRVAPRFIMKVPLRFRPVKAPPHIPEEPANSMNISTRGVYFATDMPVSEGSPVKISLKMPREVIGGLVSEWLFTGRIVHVEPVPFANGKTGVGVQFLYYEVA
jgi:hypothetical protein